MRVYSQEIKDGLESVIKNNTIACVHKAEIYNPSSREILKAQQKAVAENQDQVDLYYIKSILVSTGWNKNDDVFDPVETWGARKTPEDKQFNYMHDEKDIIGHITSCYATDTDGNILEDFNDVSQVPSVFDIVTGSVLYTSWANPELRERMQSIIKEIEEGENWYVSMECLFPNFDYAMVDPKGNSKIVKREQSSAFLTKHLRAYGGKGEYNGLKVGRLLRGFTFSGVGLVRKPANPRSVILNTDKTMIFSESMAQEHNMSNELEELKMQLAEAKTNEEEAQKAKSEFEQMVADLQAKLSEAIETIAAEKTEKEKMAEEMKTAKEKASMNEEELMKMKKEKMMMKRKADLVEAGLSETSLQETLEKFESLSDETFEVVVAALKSKQPPAEKKENEPAGPNGDKVKMQSKSELEIDENEADASVLDSAQANPDIAMANIEEDPIETVKSYAAEWFGKNVLKSTASIK